MSSKHKILFFLLSIFALISFSQSKYDIINNLEGDKLIIDSSLSFANKLMFDDNDQAKKIIQIGYSKSLSLDNYRIGEIYNLLADIYYISNNIDSSLILYKKGETTNRKLNQQKQLAESLAGLGLAYESKENLEKALELYFESYKIRDAIQDTNGLAGVLNNIGLTFYSQEKYKKSIEYLLKCCYYDSLTNNLSGLGYSYGNIGMMYYNINQNQKAIKYLKQSLKYRTQIGQKLKMGTTCNNLANVYSEIGKHDSAYFYYSEALRLKNEIGNKLEVAITLDNFGQFKSEYLNENLEALKNYKKAEKIFLELNLLDEYKLNHLLQSEAFERAGNIDSAYFYHKSFTTLKDSLQRMNNHEIIARMNTQFETENKEKQIQIQNLQLKEQNSKIEKQQLQQKWMTSLVVAAILIIIAVAFAFIQKRRDNNLLASQKEEIEEKNEELKQTNEEIIAIGEKIEEQNKKLSYQNKHIVSSIQYAKRIQEAILPSSEKVSTFLKDSAIFYKAKDIVSGDFYWIEQVNKFVLWATVDCTGHGVPGAFMSILGYNGLNKIVKEKGITKPNEILERLTNHVLNSFSSSEKGDEIKDGMDIALCCLNTETNELQFAGAYNPLYLLRDNEIEIIKGTRRPIGSFKRENIPVFENHTINISKGDILYTFTDGIADQFGGEKKSKYGYKKLRELLLNKKDLPIQEQFNFLSTDLDNWIKEGNEEQLDDICIFGVKIS